MSIRTRTYLEVRVGRTHLAEVRVNVRRDDRQWYSSKQGELLDLLTSQIIPREFDEEIESYHEKYLGRKRPVEDIGQKNISNKAKTTKTKGKRDKKQPQAPTKAGKPKRENRFAFGETVQVTYRLVDLTITRNQSSTLIFPPGRSDEEHLEKEVPRIRRKFRLLPKLSKRIVLWCYPFDKNNPNEALPQGGGFPRPELIPMTSLFRPPRNLQDKSTETE